MKYIEWELENIPHVYDKPRCDEYIDRQTLTHVVCNVNCPEDVARADFEKVIGEVAETLDLFPYFKKNNWINAKENPPKGCIHFFAAVRSLREEREPWVIEGYYVPSLPHPWGSWPMLVNGDAEVYAWMPKQYPKPPKEEDSP